MPMRVTTLVLLLIILLTSGCTLTITPPASTPPVTSTPSTSSIDVGDNGVILTPAQAAASLDAIGGKVAGTWMPTTEQVAALDAALPSFLQTAQNAWLRPDPPIWERVPNYMRQYLGLVEDGQEIIFANYFCTVDSVDWHNEYVWVMDGGDCFFQVKYNPQTGEFFDLMVNGEG